MKTPVARAAIAADWLERQASDPNVTDEHIWEQMGLTRSAFYRLKGQARTILTERLNARRKIVEEMKVQAELEAAKKGIKAREERLWELQEEAKALIAEIQAGKDVRYFVVDKQVQRLEADMSSQVKDYKRRTLLQIQAEIAKIEGDYNPEKKKVEHEFINPLEVKREPPSAGTKELDYDSIPTDILQSLLKLAREQKANDQQPAD